MHDAGTLLLETGRSLIHVARARLTARMMNLEDLASELEKLERSLQTLVDEVQERHGFRHGSTSVR